MAEGTSFTLPGACTEQTDGAAPEWALEARCRREDPALFFGPNRFEPKRERLARESAAKAICLQCPCVDVCREHAIATGETYGVWGGLGESDRRELIEHRSPLAV
ncbi:MAG: WhiB family transcriptional regulator [Nitriliruptoraceae bacterium]